MYNFLMEGVGWLGAFVLILAYGLISSGKIKPDSLGYQLLNISGGCFLVVNTFYHRAIPSLIVNLIWIIIGVFALRKRHNKS